jgi:hypothetical protein
MKLSNQNIYNLRGCKNFWGRCKSFLGGAHPPRKSVPELGIWFCNLFNSTLTNIHRHPQYECELVQGVRHGHVKRMSFQNHMISNLISVEF